MNKYWSYGKFDRNKYNRITEKVLSEIEYLQYYEWSAFFNMCAQADIVWDDNWDHVMRKLLVEARIV